MKNPSVVIKIVMSILFLACLLDLPYGYYQFIRFLGMIGFFLLGYIQYYKNKILGIVWIASGILINPIFKISLGRELWNTMDIVWTILLIVSIFCASRQKE